MIAENVHDLCFRCLIVSMIYIQLYSPNIMVAHKFKKKSNKHKQRGWRTAAQTSALTKSVQSLNFCSNLSVLLRNTTLGRDVPKKNWQIFTVSILFVLNNFGLPSLDAILLNCRLLLNKCILCIMIDLLSASYRSELSNETNWDSMAANRRRSRLAVPRLAFCILY